jgi:hypothetical protein
MAERRQLPGAGKSSRTGADHDNVAITMRGYVPQHGCLIRESGVGRVPLQCADRDRLSAVVAQDARTLAEHLDRTHARTGTTEEVLGKDRSCGAELVADGQRADEAGDVDVRWARRRAGRLGMGAAATKTTVGLDERLHRRQGWMELAGQLERRIHDLHRRRRPCGSHRDSSQSGLRPSRNHE